MFDSKARSNIRSRKRSTQVNPTKNLLNKRNMKDNEFLSAKFTDLEEKLSERDMLKTITDTEKLSDNCRIAGTTWKKLKESAMRPDFYMQYWYFGLSKDGKALLRRLVRAQRDQGDMEELVVEVSPAKKTIRPKTGKSSVCSGSIYENYLEEMKVKRLKHKHDRRLKATLDSD